MCHSNFSIKIKYILKKVHLHTRQQHASCIFLFSRRRYFSLSVERYTKTIWNEKHNNAFKEQPLKMKHIIQEQIFLFRCNSGGNLLCQIKIDLCCKKVGGTISVGTEITVTMSSSKIGDTILLHKIPTSPLELRVAVSATTDNRKGNLANTEGVSVITPRETSPDIAADIHFLKTTNCNGAKSVLAADSICSAFAADRNTRTLPDSESIVVERGRTIQLCERNPSSNAIDSYERSEALTVIAGFFYCVTF
jgi:hypothetical protein